MSPSCGLQLFTNCLSVGPSHGMQSFRNRLLQCGSPTGSQALPANLIRRGLLSPQVRRSWQEPAPVWDPHGITASFRHPPALAWGPFHGYKWISAPLWTSMDCRGTACLTMVFITSCKGRLSAPTFRAPPLSSFFTDLGVCRVVSITSSHSPSLPFLLQRYFLPFLKYVITEALPLSLIVLTLGSGGSVLEPASTGFIKHRGSFLQLLTEATPIAPLLPKHCHTNP